jgi:hypothetical protein
VELGNDLVELLLGVLGIGGELGGDVAQDCQLLGQLYGNADERAIGAEELVDLFSHWLHSYGFYRLSKLTCRNATLGISCPRCGLGSNTCHTINRCCA